MNAVTRIYDKEHDLNYVTVEFRISTDDLERAYDLSNLARALSPRSAYASVEYVLEWALFRGLLEMLPDMFQEMHDSGELDGDKTQTLIDFYNAADYETKQDIINLDEAVK